MISEWSNICLTLKKTEWWSTAASRATLAAGSVTFTDRVTITPICGWRARRILADLQQCGTPPRPTSGGRKDARYIRRSDIAKEFEWFRGEPAWGRAQGRRAKGGKVATTLTHATGAIRAGRDSSRGLKAHQACGAGRVVSCPVQSISGDMGHCIRGVGHLSRKLVCCV